MPSPLGHGLAGLALGLAFGPSAAAIDPPALDASGARQMGLAAVARVVTAESWLLAVIAAAPDLDLLVPHAHRGVSHSIGATVFVMIIAAAVTGKVTGRVGWRWVLLAGIAHGSHIVFDWMGTDRLPPQGIQAFWPLNAGYYISGWDIFPPTERRVWLPEAYAINLRAAVAEIVLVGPLTLAGFFRRTDRSRGRISGRGDPQPPSASAAGKGGTSGRRDPRAAR